MKQFFKFSLAYVFFAMAILYVFRENPGAQVIDALARTAFTLIAFVKYLPYFIGGFIVLYLAGRQFLSKNTMSEMGWALGGCLLFSAAFTFMKTSLPYVFPFYADPLFAHIDSALHGGIDPWVLTHSLAAYINPNFVSVLYFAIWGLPAAFFPFILAFCDHNAQRKLRYLILFAFVWIGLGNVLAYLGASVGPVYYDQLLGTDRFGDLITALQTSGVTDTHLGMVQSGLWFVYSEHSQAAGSGISAFPSVHNGIATLVMLYLFERSKWLAPIGIAFSAAILFASVYVGWHYAIDGYVSIILVTAAWFGLKKWRPYVPAVNPKTALTPEFEGALA
ncbi:phosphatase PAP2 family protein [Litoreibacter sp.]|nr:phosphatase PAP2 family protein [Litoreibacter sp.]